MPTFEFTSPDGKKYQITGPEGATQDQAWQILQSRQGRDTPDTPDTQGTGPSFGAGLMRGVAKTGAGLAVGAEQLGALVSPKVERGWSSLLGDKAQQLKEFATSPNETWGESIGYWGSTAATGLLAPESAILKGASWIPGLGRLASAALRGSGTAARVGRAATGAATLGALQPTESGDLTSHAINAAVAGGTGGALGAYASTPAMQAMRAAGVRTTPGQNIPWIGREMERFYSRLPVLNRMIGAKVMQSVEDFNRNILYKDALAPLQNTVGGAGALPAKAGEQGLIDLEKTITSRFDPILQQATMNDPAGLTSDVQTIAQQYRGELDGNHMRRLADILNARIPGFSRQAGRGYFFTNTLPGTDLVGKTGVVSRLNEIGRKLLISKDSQEKTLGEAVMDVQSAILNRTQFNNPGGKAELDAVRESYRRYSDIVRSITNTDARGLSDPESMLRMMQKRGNKSFQQGGSRQYQMLQQLSRQAQEVGIPRAREAYRQISPWEIAMSGHGSDLALPIVGGLFAPKLMGAAVAPAFTYNRLGMGALDLLAKQSLAAQRVMGTSAAAASQGISQ